MSTSEIVRTKELFSCFESSIDCISNPSSIGRSLLHKMFQDLVSPQVEESLCSSTSLYLIEILVKDVKTF